MIHVRCATVKALPKHMTNSVHGLTTDLKQESGDAERGGGVMEEELATVNTTHG